MAQVPTTEPWYMNCETEGCELAGIPFPVYDATSIECGGCNVVYEKPE
jgi:hypothetical protein